MLAGCLGGVEVAAYHVTKVLPTSVLVEKGSDQEGGGDIGKVQLDLELKDLMVTNNGKGPESGNNLAHEDILNGTGEDLVDNNDVSPDKAGKVPGGDLV